VNKTTKRLNWDDALARLEEARRSLEQGVEPTAGDLSAIYRERAERLANGAEEGVVLSEPNSIIVFRVGEWRYAVSSADVQEVLPDLPMTPVPGAPAAVMGVIQVRGEIRPVYNILAQLGVEGAPSTDGPVLLVRTGQVTVGIKASAVDESRAIGAHANVSVLESAAVAWVTEDFVSVLNPRAMWRREH
jgi:purine-binding chemotaxis protein CheW